MGITRRDKAELVGVLHTLCFQRQAIAQGLTDITALLFTVQASADTELINFKIGPLVIGRQQRMSIGGALDLGDLHNRLVANALIGVFIVHRVARPVHELEHLAVGAIRVVGNRQTFDALISQRIHPVPETLRVLGIQPGKRYGRQFICAAEHDVAMQVTHIVGGRGVLVGHKGREMPGVVVLLSRIDDVRPGTAGHSDRHFFRDLSREDARQGVGDE